MADLKRIIFDVLVEDTRLSGGEVRPVILATGGTETQIGEGLADPWSATGFKVYADVDLYADTRGLTAVWRESDGAVVVGPAPFVPPPVPDQAPIVDSVTPNSGPASGGTLVSIIGDLFDTVTGAMIKDLVIGEAIALTQLRVVSMNELQGLTSQAAMIRHDVPQAIVLSSGGGFPTRPTSTTPDLFTYLAP